ncbi:MAG: serine/threonine-protein kinase [Polyangiaceae bacterium]
MIGSAPGRGFGEVHPGDRLGRYEILLAVAQGGMARVWAAKQHGQRGFSKVVAIKTILPNLAEDETFERMFLDEARVAAGVHHPNVCEIFDLGEEDGVLYLAMEWVEGESLARVLKPGTGVEGALPQRLNARLAAKIIAEACGGLHAAHELTDDHGQRLDVVHRDVSPQNILVGSNGSVKVMDFGVAKALGMSTETTSAGQIKGKAPYMSPEQAGGQKIDRRSDVFALGICLYEATTGKRPFSAPGGNQIQIIKQILSGQFEPPSAHVPGYPQELEQIILKAMAMDPFHRFATADRMKTALEEWLARSGPVITQTHIGAELQARVGHIVSERQEHIKHLMRQSLARVASSPRDSFQSVGDQSASVPSFIRNVAPTSTSGAELSQSAISTPRKRPSAMGTVFMGVGIGLGAFLLIGGLGFGGWYLLGGSKGSPEPVAAATVAPPPVAAPPAASQKAEPVPLKANVEYITVRTMPADGVSLEFEGSVLKPGVNRVPRPLPGSTRKLIARADGYEEQTLNLDSETPSTVDLVLSAKAAPTKAEEPAAAPAATHEERAKPAAKPEKPAEKPKPAPVDIPDNPFD